MAPILVKSYQMYGEYRLYFTGNPIRLLAYSDHDIQKFLRKHNDPIFHVQFEARMTRFASIAKQGQKKKDKQLKG